MFEVNAIHVVAILIADKHISNFSGLDVAEQNVVVHFAALPIITERISQKEAI